MRVCTRAHTNSTFPYSFPHTHLEMRLHVCLNPAYDLFMINCAAPISVCSANETDLQKTQRILKTLFRTSGAVNARGATTQHMTRLVRLQISSSPTSDGDRRHSCHYSSKRNSCFLPMSQVHCVTAPKDFQGMKRDWCN